MKVCGWGRDENTKNVCEPRQPVKRIALGELLAEFLEIEPLEFGKNVGFGLHVYKVYAVAFWTDRQDVMMRRASAADAHVGWCVRDHLGQPNWRYYVAHCIRATRFIRTQNTFLGCIP